MRKIVIGLGCAAAIGALASQACQIQGACESSPQFVEYCSGNASDPYPCQGHIWADGLHWDSGPLDGTFLPFGAGQVWHMHYMDAQTKQVLSGDYVEASVQVGATAQPNVGGSSWIECSVGMCNFTSLDTTSLYVQNGTCSPYFFHVVVTLGQRSATDAGTD